MSSSIPNLHDEAYIVYLSSRVRNDYSNRVSCCTLFLYSINFDSTQKFHCLTLLIKCVRKMILVLQGNWNSQRKMKHNKYFNIQPYTTYFNDMLNILNVSENILAIWYFQHSYFHIKWKTQRRKMNIFTIRYAHFASKIFNHHRLNFWLVQVCM